MGVSPVHANTSLQSKIIVQALDSQHCSCCLSFAAQPYSKPYPKPSVSMSSSEVVTQGENITIRCKNENLQQAEFSLGKQVGSSIHYLDRKKAEQNEVIFTISSASQSNAGIYRCIYCFEISTEYYWCSDYSDEVHINVRGENLSWSSYPFFHKSY